MLGEVKSLWDRCENSAACLHASTHPP
jgi:hypothetical protein